MEVGLEAATATVHMSPMSRLLVNFWLLGVSMMWMSGSCHIRYTPCGKHVGDIHLGMFNKIKQVLHH